MLASLHKVHLKITTALILVFFVPAFVNAQEVKTFANPLSFPSVESLLIAILNALIVISLPIVVLFIVYSGFKYVTAQGNPEQVKEATRALTYGVIGGVIIVGAAAIVQIITSLVESF